MKLEVGTKVKMKVKHWEGTGEVLEYIKSNVFPYYCRVDNDNTLRYLCFKEEELTKLNGEN